MENHQPKKKRKNSELILMIFVLVGTGLILIEIAQNIITHLLGN